MQLCITEINDILTYIQTEIYLYLLQWLFKISCARRPSTCFKHCFSYCFFQSLFLCLHLSVERDDINSWHCFSVPSVSQSSSDAPSTPKFSKDQRDYFFPASFSTPCLHSHTYPAPTQDGEAKLSKSPRPLLIQPPTHSTSTQIYCLPSSQHDQSQQRKTPSQPIASMAFLPHIGTAYRLSCLLLNYWNHFWKWHINKSTIYNT